MKTRIINIRNNKKARYVVLYTALFALIFTVGYSTFIFGNLTFLHYGDALMQHYPALIYAGDYLRALPGHLMNAALPMYDFSIGMGDDIFAPLMTHSANADIFHLLFAFIPRENAYTAYVIVIILRMYFSGLTFSYFCHTALKADKRFILLGALIYVFGGWTYVQALRHPSFTIALMYLPIVIAGLDQILRKKKPYLFILSVFLLGLASFYFLYMVTIFAVIYALIRVFHLRSINHPSLRSVSSNLLIDIIRIGLKSAGYYLTGLMMAAVTLIPLLTAHFSTGRETNITLDSLLLYPMQAYIDIFTSYPSPVPLGNQNGMTWYGLSALIPLLLIILFFIKPRRKHLICGVCIAMLFQNIPFFALMLNGFGYVSNRSEFLFNFVYCIAAVIVLSDLFRHEKEISNGNLKQMAEPKQLSKKAIIAMAVYIVTLTAAAFFAADVGESAVLFIRVGIAFVAVLFLLLIIPVNNPSISFVTNERKPIILCAVVILNLMVNVSAFYWFIDTSFVDKNAGDIYQDYVSVSDYADDDSFYRQGTPFTVPRWDFNERQCVNALMLFGDYGISEYWSLGNPAYADFSYEHENIAQHARWRVHSFDNRTVLNELASVKYIFSTYGIIPFGYEPVSELVFRELYVNKYALPLGYTYDKIISTGEYDKLSALDKQDALLQAVALPQEYKNTDITQLNFVSTQIPYEIIRNDGLVWESGILEVKNESEIIAGDVTDQLLQQHELTAILGISIDEQFVCGGNCETYIRFIGLDSTKRNTMTGVVSAASNTENPMAGSTFFSRFVDEYHGRNDHILNLGYSEEPVTDVEIRFTDGIYTLKDIEIYCVPMENYPQLVCLLSEDVLENIEIGVNTVTGNITLDRNKTLVLSIPYSRGWSAKVNGESTRLLQANTAYMAIPLNKGVYDIELYYETPGLKLGAAVSLTGLLAFAVLLYIGKKKRI